MDGHNILPMIGISPGARRRWNDAIEQFAAASADPRYGDSTKYPEERAVLVEGGLMALRITFEDGSELEMKFGPSDWRWLNGVR